MRTPWSCVATLALLLNAGSRAEAQAAASPPEATQITMTRAALPTGTSGAAWDMVLPKQDPGTLTDQAWLVVDGKFEGLGGGDFSPGDAAKPLRVYAGVSDSLDGQVKDILKAQGVPVKPNVTTYRVTYGVNTPGTYSLPLTLRFRHGAYVIAYTQLPETASYKVGDRVTVFDAVALDEGVTMADVLDPKDPDHRTFRRLPNDRAHRITIQVQFLPAPH